MKLVQCIKDLRKERDSFHYTSYDPEVCVEIYQEYLQKLGYALP